MEKKDYILLLLSASLISSMFLGIQPDLTHSCKSEQSQRYCFDVSSGLHTRCYIDPDKNSWDYCSSGWEPIAEWAEYEDPINRQAEICYPEPRGCEEV